MAILRLAVCEMLFIDDVPPKASIDQAVELAKKYCNDKSPSYINGILNACYKELLFFYVLIPAAIPLQ